MQDFRRILGKSPSLLDHWCQYMEGYDGHLGAGPFLGNWAKSTGLFSLLRGYRTTMGWHTICSTPPRNCLHKLLEDAWYQHLSHLVAHRTDFHGLQGIDGELCRLSEARLTSLETARLHAQRDGSFFTGVQRRKYDHLSDGKCVLCGADDDIEHRCLHCPGLAGIRAGYPDIGQLWASSPICLRERLLPPRNGLYQQVKHQLFSLPITANCSEVTADVGQEVHLFTDGSCSTERLPSLRLASWSIVSATHSRVVAFGPLHGLPQTINRAELTAVISAVEWLGACHASGVIYTDLAYVASGAWRLLHDHADLPKSNGDLWQLLSLAVDAMSAGSLGIRHVSGHLHANSCDDPIDEWAARWNDEADKAAKFANRRRHTTFMQSWSAYREAELDMQRRLDQLVRLHLDIAEQLSKHPAADRLDVDDEFEAELPLHVGLLVARPEAQHPWAEWIVPQDAINIHLAASFGQAFFEAAFSWIRHQQQSADACVCLSWSLCCGLREFPSRCLFPRRMATFGRMPVSMGHTPMLRPLWFLTSCWFGPFFVLLLLLME